ncbi:MAG: hypothetical protein QM770_16190 [Tepidisphaeraceae bacterium]
MPQVPLFTLLVWTAFSWHLSYLASFVTYQARFQAEMGLTWTSLGYEIMRTAWELDRLPGWVFIAGPVVGALAAHAAFSSEDLIIRRRRRMRLLVIAFGLAAIASTLAMQAIGETFMMGTFGVASGTSPTSRPSGFPW